MISPRTKPCRKECPMPKKLEGYRSGRGRQYNPYHDHYLRLRYTTIEERTQPTGAYISYIPYVHTIFLLNNYSLRDPLYIRPNIFYFRDPPSRLPFTTHFSRLTSATTLAAPLHDSRLQPHLRLSFTTPDCAPNRDSLHCNRDLP